MTQPLYVVTGGAGFIGSQLASRLVTEGARVRVIDNLSTGSKDNLPVGVDLVEKDVVNISSKYFEGAKAVYHLAARPSVSWSLGNLDESHKINYVGTESVVRAAETAGVDRFLYVSSAAVHGVLNFLKDGKGQKSSPYALHKLMSELRVIRSNLVWTIFRPFNVYGPGHRDGAVYHFMKHVRERIPIKIDGDGSQVRDFVHVSDVARAIHEASWADKTAKRIYDIGTGHSTSVMRLASLVCRHTGAKATFEFSGKDPGDHYSKAETTPAWNDFCFEARTYLEAESGIKALVDRG